MIRKSISGILLLLIFINSIGCYSYKQIKIENTEEFEKNDEVKITTLDEKVYILSDVTIDGLEARGVVVPTHSGWLRDIQGKEIVISIKEIKKIEVETFETFETGTIKIVIVVSVLVLVGIIWLIAELKESMENWKLLTNLLRLWMSNIHILNYTDLIIYITRLNE